ncbi:hypothetical protein HanRHA438_Chr15g0716111 [Helianthus annuus]|uniref:Uncharacterized protein n=1 Tax=Helianthus annuus TaxID=4232 RepID=A0A9K3E1S2_HELAN|nr:hypothetical protein HanXRQr2_Chr15g0703751 [Helianthus annuus]KAJ0451974.1 hypothetical protein HanHA300_Chr15g0573671 [Helianthus annuus]KAJ0456701.1 hypothetical protein HanIR_Chr15g0765451 [Helianthus annuus]KAJ0473857.1 hypothetical protein HanHA89_Chr15g0623131 [Helianthus annuus]KAJ0649433.1 hypothetical protein HanLR1_Chr15g0584221 [Helianthus annuus]
MWSLPCKQGSGTIPLQFLYSKSHNKFVYEGCGNAVVMNESQVLTVCSHCHNESRIDRNNYFGSDCCRTKIPYFLKSYTINISRQDGDDRGCGSAFLVDEYSYVEGRFSEDNNSYVPVSLLWTLPQLSDIYQVACDTGWAEVDLGNGNTMKSWKCSPIYGRISDWQVGNRYIYGGTTCM